MAASPAPVPGRPGTPVEDVPGYRDLVPIGRGGFSTVYRAHQEAFDRPVALKVLTIEFDDTVRRRFLREVRLTGRLTGHPHVVTILDAGMTWSGRPYLATGLYENGSLRDRLKATGPLPPSEVATIGAKIAGALSAAHDVGVVHRDVKPNNILVSRFGEPALADFGVACLLDSLASATVLDVFSPHHAAPEVVNRGSSGEIGAASDVYALGSTLYELLAGKPPFGQNGEEVLSILWQIVNDPPPPLSCPEMPALAEAIGKALAKNPVDRFVSAAEFAEALRVLVPGAENPDDPEASTGEAPSADGSAPKSAAGDGDSTPRGKTRPTLPDGGGTGGTVYLSGPAYATDTSSMTGRRDVFDTRFRPDRQPETPEAEQRKRRAGRLWTTVSVLTMLLAGGVVAVAVKGFGATPRDAKPKPAVTAPSPNPVDPQVLDAARPTGVTADDLGTFVTVHWHTASGNHDQLVVETKSSQPGSQWRTDVVPGGASSLPVAGLDPHAGYCFVVGAVVVWGTPSVVSRSAPVCIRGAVAETASTPGTPGPPGTAPRPSSRPTR